MPLRRCGRKGANCAALAILSHIAKRVSEASRGSAIGNRSIPAPKKKPRRPDVMAAFPMHWEQHMRLITFALRIFDGLSKKQRAIKGCAQRHSGRDIALQVSNYRSNVGNAVLGGDGPCCDQRNSDYPIQ